MGALTLEVGGWSFDGAASGTKWIGRDGLDGWWDSPEVLGEDVTLDDRDGALDPVESFVGPRRVNVLVQIESSNSNAAAREARQWASSLSKSNDLKFRVNESGQWLHLRNAEIRGQVRVRPNRQNMRLTEASFTVWAADPRKYGEMQQRTVAAITPPTGGLSFPLVDGSLNFHATTGTTTFPGVFTLPNPGTIEYLPIFTVTGPLAGFAITSESQVIRYDGPVGVGQTLILSPWLGGRAVLDGTDVSTNLTEASWVPVRAGEERGFLFTPLSPGPAATLTIDYPNGAWI